MATVAQMDRHVLVGYPLMNTEEILIHPANQPEMHFQGHVIAHAASPEDDPRLHGRRFEITVYETDSGDWHLVIDFKTVNSNETSRVDVEKSIHPDELPEVLMSYDPSEYIDSELLDRRSDPEVSQFLKYLYRHYDDLCALIEHQVSAYERRGGAPDSESVGGPDEAAQSQKKNDSFWRSWMGLRKPR